MHDFECTYPIATIWFTDLVHAAQLELRLLIRNTVKHEASLRVVQQPEQVARLLNVHHICQRVREESEVGSSADGIRSSNTALM